MLKFQISKDINLFSTKDRQGLGHIKCECNDRRKIKVNMNSIIIFINLKREAINSRAERKSQWTKAKNQLRSFFIQFK